MFRSQFSAALFAQGFVFAAVIPTATAQQLFPGLQLKSPDLARIAISADVDNDGNLDLIVDGSKSWGAGSFDVALGDGHGGFGPFVRHDVLYNPVRMAAGDFDGDGNVDLVMTDGYDVSLQLGDGHGQFAESNALISPFASSLAVGDFDGDGRLDLVTATSNESTPSTHATLFRGDGHGHLSSAISIPIGSEVSALAVGDVNGDGRLDLVASSPQFVLVTLLNVGGIFAVGNTASIGTDNPLTVELADLDHDGKLDAIVAGRANLFVLRGDGNGGFATPIAHPALNGTTAMHLGDVNGDGELDAVMSGYSISVFLGDGHAGFAEPRLTANCGLTRDFALADFNHDGLTDAVTTEWTSVLGLHFGSEFGFDGPSASVTGFATAQAIADFDHDGRPDLVKVGGATPGQVYISLGDGRGRFTLVQTFDAMKNPSSVAVGDFDRDGNQDVVVGAPGKHAFWLYRGDGSGDFAPPSNHDCRVTPSKLAALDFDGDGALDVAVVHFAGPQPHPVVSIEHGDGHGSFAHQTDIDLGVQATDAAFGDLDGDGDVDVVATAPTSHSLEIFLNDGHGSFSASQVALPGLSPRSIALTDVDRDGALDFVFDSTTNQVVTAFGDGHGGVRSTNQFAWTFDATFIDVTDLDGDGRLDYVLMDLSNDIAVFAGDGLGGAQAQLFATKLHLSSAPMIADVDLDGRPDLVFGMPEGLTGTWLNLLDAPPGTSDFGSGTPGCNGAQGITASVASHVGAQDFAVLISNAPPNSRGFGWLGDTANIQGSYAFGHGVLLHVDPLGAYQTFPIASDGAGSARASLPIPNDGSLIGKYFYAQTFWHWSECSPSPSGLSSSRALSFEVLN